MTEQRKLIGDDRFILICLGAVSVVCYSLAGMSSIFKDNPDAQNMIHLAISFTQIGFGKAIFIFWCIFSAIEIHHVKIRGRRKRIDENKQ